MVDDTDLGRFANLIGLVIVGLLFAYHYVAAEARQ